MEQSYYLPALNLNDLKEINKSTNMAFYGHKGNRFLACADSKYKMAKAAKERAKKVRCINTGTVYNSATEAYEQTGVSKSAISQICNGTLDTCKGFRFEFVN